MFGCAMIKKVDGSSLKEIDTQRLKEETGTACTHCSSLPPYTLICGSVQFVISSDGNTDI